MIGLDIRNKKYQACSGWKDLTLEKFIELSEIKIPEKLEQLWVASAELNTDDKKALKVAQKKYEAVSAGITQGDLIKFFPAYYGRVFEVLTDIPKAIISQISPDLRTTFFDDYMRGFVLSLIYSQPVISKNGAIELFQPEEITEFELDGKIYYFPKSLKLYDEIIPMADEEVISFAEAADIDLAIRDLRSEGIKRFPMFMGIYCREKDEKYSEADALRRAEIFKKCDMSVIWSLFFYTVQLTHTSRTSIETYLLQKVGVAGKAITEAVD